MTRDDIIRMAREAGITTPEPVDRRWHLGACSPLPALERFAALAAAAEREACASIDVGLLHILASDGPGEVIKKYTAAIRARGQA